MGIKKKRDFAPHAFLATLGEGRKVVPFEKKQIIFSQGDAADAVFYIQSGKVKLTVVSNNGKEATIGLLSEKEFFGEGCLIGQPLRMAAATAMTDCELLRTDLLLRWLSVRLKFVSERTPEVVKHQSPIWNFNLCKIAKCSTRQFAGCMEPVIVTRHLWTRPLLS